MKVILAISILLLSLSSALAEELAGGPGHGPFNPNAIGNAQVGGNPFTFNNLQPPYGTGGNPYSIRKGAGPSSEETPLTPFDQRGNYRGSLTPPPADVDSIGNTYGHYGDRHSLDSLNSLQGSQNPLTPFGTGWHIYGGK